VSEQDVDRIVEELMEHPLSRDERIRLLRELVEQGRELPDALLQEALGRLLERIADN
jgi:hypothetical protein